VVAASPAGAAAALSTRPTHSCAPSSGNSHKQHQSQQLQLQNLQQTATSSRASGMKPHSDFGSARPVHAESSNVWTPKKPAHSATTSSGASSSRGAPPSTAVSPKPAMVRREDRSPIPTTKTDNRPKWEVDQVVYALFPGADAGTFAIHASSKGKIRTIG
jgi:hypothetical protein